MKRSQAFTLIELLVVIAIIAILVAVLLPALAAARTQAVTTRALAAIKQSSIAYVLYADDHKGRVITGFLSQTPNATINDGFAGTVSGVPTKRYPWRLSSYLELGLLGTLFTDEQSQLFENIPAANERILWHYDISLQPSFGLNSHFIGGWEGTSADFSPVTNLSSVISPDKFIVFASAKGRVGSDDYNGWHTVDSPQWGHFFNTNTLGTSWARDPYDHDKLPELWGNIDARYAGKVMTAHADAHAELLSPAQLRDMQRWANDAVTAGDPDWKPRRR